jgi:hypothetical protein
VSRMSMLEIKIFRYMDIQIYGDTDLWNVYRILSTAYVYSSSSSACACYYIQLLLYIVPHTIYRICIAVYSTRYIVAAAARAPLHV